MTRTPSAYQARYARFIGRLEYAHLHRIGWILDVDQPQPTPRRSRRFVADEGELARVGE